MSLDQKIRVTLTMFLVAAELTQTADTQHCSGIGSPAAGHTEATADARKAPG